MGIQSIGIWRAIVNAIKGAGEMYRAWRDDEAELKRREAASLEKMIRANRELSGRWGDE